MTTATVPHVGQHLQGCVTCYAYVDAHITDWPPAYRPMWRDQAERLAEKIEHAHAHEGRGLSLYRIDHAIQHAAERYCDREGYAQMPDIDYGGMIWHSILEAILARLDIDADEIEVTE